MRRPRPVRLTEGERRALRAMEEALTAEDLDLQVGSAGETSGPRRRPGRLLVVHVVLSAFLFLLGVGAADLRVQGFGVLMLISATVVRPCIIELKRRWP